MHMEVAAIWWHSVAVKSLQGIALVALAWSITKRMSSGSINMLVICTVQKSV